MDFARLGPQRHRLALMLLDGEGTIPRIALEFGVSEKQASTMVHRIYRDAGVNNRAEFRCAYMRSWWEQDLAAIAAFAAEHGHVEVAAGAVETANGFDLGETVSRLRDHHAGRKPGGLRQRDPYEGCTDWEAELDRLPGWSWE